MAKQILVYLYNRTFFRNTKKQTNDTHNNVNTSQNNSSE